MRNTHHHHHHHPTVGQLSLSQRARNNNNNNNSTSSANSTTATLVVPQRVQLVQTVNIDYFPVQNQVVSGNDDNGFCFTEVFRTQEVVRTQFLNSATTRDRFLQAPNHHQISSHCYGGPSQSQAQAQAQAQANPIFNHGNNTNPVHHHNIGYQYNNNQCFNGSKGYNNSSHYQYAANPSHVFHQNPSQSSSSSSSRLRLIESDEHGEDEEVIVFDVQPMNVDLFSSENDPIFPDTQRKQKRKQKQKQKRKQKHSPPPPPPPSSPSSPPSHEDDDYDDDDADFNVDEEELKELEEEEEELDEDLEDCDLESSDGRTHSLPYRKYGPYTCPKCKKVFKTSQLFAAHMGSHYKYESKAQRKRRLLAKYGLSKYLEMVKPRNNNGVIMTRIMVTTPHHDQNRYNKKRSRLHRRLANNNNNNNDNNVGVGSVRVGDDDDDDDERKQQVLEDIKFEGLFLDVKIKEE
ncbi:uncharacterized protein LOC133789609 [Humulus lupulus]|uniref:uncharacterized protein LOC133789609 n=1 Tax=Humulus lupulus TaxID=3486 RepID=UPI002B40B9FA|nr:uncharacterized protein LOC133789609 [Humulus lupulus]